MALISVCVLLLCWSSLTSANLAPSVNEILYRVCEDVPVGEIAFRILATDPDNDPLTYSLSGVDASYFSISSEPSDGTVYVARSLDRERGPMDVSVTVRDPHQSCVGCPVELVLVIDDANDNKPIFEDASYEATISETAAIGSTLFRVLATDADTGPAAAITYRVEESVPSSGLTVFTVNSLGDVTVNGKLNYTSLSTYYRIKINAKDGGGKCYGDVTVYQSSSVFAFITILDAPDMDPLFIGAPYTKSVEENTPIGGSVLTVTAVDQDTGINDKIDYSWVEESPLFSIDENGLIAVKSAIDREVIGDTVDLTVKATERNVNINGVRATATASVRITITDMNDNSPKFYKCTDECVPTTSFSGDVKEHSLGAVPIGMTVKDADKIVETELSLDGDYKDTFTVEPAVAFSDSIVQLIVKNSEDLDYEKIQQISLKVIAVDKLNPAFRATADVTINILDINDHNPTFTNDTYYAKIPEHVDNGTTVITITAIDPDSMDQGKITYRLLPTSILGVFDVELTTGRVYVKNGALLDRESRALYSVTLQAQDSDLKPGSTVLDITITDINDHPPVPNRGTYQEVVPEGQKLENVKIEATDNDEHGTPNSELVFTIEPGPFSDDFTIDAKTGVLSSKEPLDRESIDPAQNGKIELKVKISDKGVPPLSAEVNVIINVQDINDNKPVFQRTSYRFSVKESEKGIFVGSVYATDDDQTDEFNRISFSIISGALGSFTIRSARKEPGYNGNINVDLDTELDYETQKSYNLEVEAADFGQEKANVIVEVIVVDVNDERPEFQPIVTSVNVKENSKETWPIGDFSAVDKDGNHSLVYEQVSVECRCARESVPCNWFVVERNGSVIINPEAHIDYESCDQVTVEANVVDEYTEKGENSSATPGTMVINILDMNDNHPEFMYSGSVFVLVSESASKGTSVAGVSATDRDSGANGQIDFQVSKVEFEDLNGRIKDAGMLFEAITTQQKDLFVGIIQSTQKLDTTLQGKYLVTVVAKDNGGLTNTTVLDIFIIDETYKIQLRFATPKSEVEAKESEIIKDLTFATKAAVRVVALKESASETAKATIITIMEAYFVYGNGTALQSQTLEKILSEPNNYMTLSQYGLIYVGVVDPGEPPVNTGLYVLFGAVGALIIVTAVLTTSLLCTRRNYRRKLKAANAMKSASGMSENQRGGPVVPGTNLYTMEGANPVLNLNIDATLDMGEDSDVDKVSLNSLDNSDVGTEFEKDTKPIVKIQDEDKDGPPKYIENLDAALAQRDNKMTTNPLLGDDNPIFDTTDL
ncbi:cadherin-related family member 2 [Periophthalmus magnuspinnatus]|uniref:cadherin-related family member 2 n=1 Tax=Periophthalmus magnuspinnatus TaxID=409849 RepID=UPI00145A2950|nr:cadherin-related family member 2 [Periophthalmus magnuspinnatus]